ncbi:nucleotide kinase domain-containing protein [Variovorax boronicumulans]|uniref:nucleotide kinase domain-containing protein n=1 Tax=Variovorax boronicumulans TaxID=436515 RepID=UPI001C590599
MKRWRKRRIERLQTTSLSDARFVTVTGKNLGPRPNSSKTNGATTFAKRTEPTPTIVYDSYWKFAAERQQLYFNRLTDEHGPWTQDPVLKEYKFTNAYRAADRVSQYLIRQVIYRGSFDELDVAFRTLLFKLFNKIETWELLTARFGPLSRATFDVARFDAALSEAIRANQRIYSAAYIMPNAPRLIEGSYKHRTHLDLLSSMVKTGLFEKLFATGSMREVYELLLSLPSIGPFLAYQYAVDLNYSDIFEFSENEFVQPGPGALNGLTKCFSSLGDYSPADAIRWVTERQESEFKTRGLDFKSLWGRPLQLIDCQNLFCEVDKYARVVHPEFSVLTGRARIKQKFSSSGELPSPYFPPKWKLKLELPKKTSHWPFPKAKVRCQNELFV